MFAADTNSWSTVSKCLVHRYWSTIAEKPNCKTQNKYFHRKVSKMPLDWCGHKSCDICKMVSWSPWAVDRSWNTPGIVPFVCADTVTLMPEFVYPQKRICTFGFGYSVILAAFWFHKIPSNHWKQGRQLRHSPVGSQASLISFYEVAKKSTHWKKV